MPDPGTFTTLHIAITAAITAAVGLPGATLSLYAKPPARALGQCHLPL
jgi:hypothetical protein